jgi:hypothetical protein
MKVKPAAEAEAEAAVVVAAGAAEAEVAAAGAEDAVVDPSSLIATLRTFRVRGPAMSGNAGASCN